MKPLLLLTALLAVAASPAGAAGPSFDCAKAQTDTEWAICNTPTLAAWDARMAGVYAEFSPDAPTKNAQRKWIKTRNACVGNVDCLMTAYGQRLRELEGSTGIAGEDRSVPATPLPKACKPSELTIVETDKGDAGMSKATRAYLIRYTGKGHCALRGYPALTVHDLSGAVQIGYPNYSTAGYYVRFPGQPGYVMLAAQSRDAWFSLSTSSGCDARSEKTGLQVDVALPLSTRSLKRIDLAYVTCRQVTVTPIGGIATMEKALNP